MIELKITKKFNDDIMFPMDVYTIDVYLRPEPIKSNTMEYEDYLMEEYAISKEDWDGMSDREKLSFEYNVEAGNRTRSAMYDAMDFMEKVDENIIPNNEKKKILKNMEKAMMVFEYPFDLKLNRKF